MSSHKVSNISANRLRSMTAASQSLFAFMRYNAQLTFANKFIYFLLGAIALLLFILIVSAATMQTPPGPESVYYYLLAPGVLLIFYPAVFSLQQDADAGMLETLFGIPNYRYKVWLVRNAVGYVVMAIMLLVLSAFCRVAIADFSILEMTFQLLFPIVLIGSVAFMLSTLTKSGNATSVLMVLFILFFWIASEPLEGSRWNLFHNPFREMGLFETILWAETTLYNRIYILVGSVIALMFGLLRLQNREKLI